MITYETNIPEYQENNISIDKNEISKARQLKKQIEINILNYIEQEINRYRDITGLQVKDVEIATTDMLSFNDEKSSFMVNFVNIDVKF
jgi:hypothetical protein